MGRVKLPSWAASRPRRKEKEYLRAERQPDTTVADIKDALGIAHSLWKSPIGRTIATQIEKQFKPDKPEEELLTEAALRRTGAPKQIVMEEEVITPEPSPPSPAAEPPTPPVSPPVLPIIDTQRPIIDPTLDSLSEDILKKLPFPPTNRYRKIHTQLVEKITKNPAFGLDKFIEAINSFGTLNDNEKLLVKVYWEAKKQVHAAEEEVLEIPPLTEKERADIAPAVDIEIKEEEAPAVYPTALAEMEAVLDPLTTAAPEPAAAPAVAPPAVPEPAAAPAVPTPTTRAPTALERVPQQPPVVPFNRTYIERTLLPQMGAVVSRDIKQYEGAVDDIMQMYSTLKSRGFSDEDVAIGRPVAEQAEYWQTLLKIKEHADRIAPRPQPQIGISQRVSDYDLQDPNYIWGKGLGEAGRFAYQLGLRGIDPKPYFSEDAIYSLTEVSKAAGGYVEGYKNPLEASLYISQEYQKGDTQRLRAEGKQKSDLQRMKDMTAIMRTMGVTPPEKAKIRGQETRTEATRRKMGREKELHNYKLLKLQSDRLATDIQSAKKLQDLAKKAKGKGRGTRKKFNPEVVEEFREETLSWLIKQEGLTDRMIISLDSSSKSAYNNIARLERNAQLDLPQPGSDEWVAMFGASLDAYHKQIQKNEIDKTAKEAITKQLQKIIKANKTRSAAIRTNVKKLAAARDKIKDALLAGAKQKDLEQKQKAVQEAYDLLKKVMGPE